MTRRIKRRTIGELGPTDEASAGPLSLAATKVRNLRASLRDHDRLLGRRDVDQELARIEELLKVTLENRPTEPGDNLVNESVYLASEQGHSDEEETIVLFSGESSDNSVEERCEESRDRHYRVDGLVLTTVRRAGRASVSRPRQSYFDAPAKVSPEEQLNRSRRSREANARSAARSAADHAIAADCGLWATFTFIEPVSWTEAVEASRRFLNMVSRRHNSLIREHLYYVGVVDVSQAHPHLHVLMSRTADREMLSELWTNGTVESVTLIPPELIEQKVNYMKNRVLHVRATSSRFLRTRGLDLGITREDVFDFDHARDLLCDQIQPLSPRVVSAQPFGGNPRLGFRFTPLNPSVDSDVSTRE